MAYRSLIWDGSTVGDATLAPYDADEFNQWFTAAVQAGIEGTFVVPGYLDDLDVSVVGVSPITRISVSPGAALVQGHVYINESTQYYYVPDNSEASVYRYDSVILRLDKSKQTIRLDYVEGIESAVFPPSPPTLVQNGTVWETELARIYVDSDDFTMTGAHLYDQREFLMTDWAAKTFSDRNLLKNSEFMAFSLRILGTTYYPDYWEEIGSGNRIHDSKIAPMSRGRSIKCTNAGIGQSMTVSPEQTVFSLRGLVNITSGTATVSFYGIRSNGLNSGKTFTVEIRESGEWRGYIQFTETDLAQVRFEISSDSGVFSVGQTLIAHGYHTGPFRQIHETLMFEQYLYDAAWNATSKGVGSTVIDLTASFAGLVLPYTHAVILDITADDSGSAGANDVYLRAVGEPSTTIYGELQLGRTANDYKRSRHFLVPVDQDMHQTGDETPQFVIAFKSSGGSVLEATVRILGLVS